MEQLDKPGSYNRVEFDRRLKRVDLFVDLFVCIYVFIYLFVVMEEKVSVTSRKKCRRYPPYAQLINSFNELFNS